MAESPRPPYATVMDVLHSNVPCLRPSGSPHSRRFPDRQSAGIPTHPVPNSREITNPRRRENPGVSARTQPPLNHARQHYGDRTATAPNPCRTLTCPNHRQRRSAPQGGRLPQTAPSTHETRPTGLGLTCEFSRWQVLGSNQRRLSRRFYRPPVLIWLYAT
jgi:hypothetical protein